MLIASLMNHSLSSKEHTSWNETGMCERIGPITTKMPGSQDKAIRQQCSALLTEVTIMHIIQAYNILVCNSFFCQRLDGTPDIV